MYLWAADGAGAADVNCGGEWSFDRLKLLNCGCEGSSAEAVATAWLQ
ncbi:hypothetical protein RW092_18735 [Paenibacillus sp. 3LSP]|nr:hypothetical protein [Paenibacillus sp. 3LSP]MDU0332214.1 hypothetical protein [Paenibacillus sp. 3LSP]